ncbi:hypothetical protein [Marivirga tractuosa]|uniref:hypothetical protein n=1 Tax=Marivirga tractuosa TaxID=1006 RepID=UPI0002E0C226|nr:hypothetical protein [Marivirga tractuosa]
MARTKQGLARVAETKKLGRPIGSKDTKKRKTDGYKLREAKKLLSKANNTPPK